MAVVAALLLSLLFIASVVSIFLRLPTATIAARRKLILPWLTRHNNKPPEAPTKATASKATSKVAIRGGEEEIKQVFGAFDKNKDGFITRKELGESLRQMGISDDDEVDSNGGGLIDLDEFSGMFDTTAYQGHKEEEEEEEVELREAFDVFDGDRDGLITAEELGVVLGALGMKEGEREESCREMIRKVDVDGDGMVSFDEFKKMMVMRNNPLGGADGGGGGVRLVPAF